MVFYDCRNSNSNLRVLDCASAHLIHTRLFDHRKRLLDKSQIVTTFTELRYLKEPGHDFTANLWRFLQIDSLWIKKSSSLNVWGISDS